MPLVSPSGTSSHPKNALRKRKLEIKVLLVLHVLIPGVMLSSLETINPWLSACDLRHQDAATNAPDAACAAPALPPPFAQPAPHPTRPPLCPDECSPSETPAKTNASCLAYLNDTRRNAICNFNLGNGIEWLKSFLGTIRLRYCCEYKIIESLSASLLERVLRGKDECFRIIDSLVEVDNLAQRLTCEFSEVLTRYDCRQSYSVKFSCNDCLEAYRRWVCSTLVPYYNDSVRIRPCRSVCQAVEQKCPYFLPENRAPSLPTQYAGEPTFLCMDPNIPEVGEQQRRSLYPDDTTCCVKICGSLQDGLCVEKGSQCKSEELISYEEALDQVVDCAADTMGTRVPNLECTASEPYSSPHKLGSGGRRTLPRAPLVLLLACLHPGCPQYLLCVVDLLLGLLGLLPGALLRFGHRRRRGTAVKLFFHFVKRPSFASNHLRFGSYKWQYYFILISVNLLPNLFIKIPQPLTPPFLFDVFTRSNETRRARRYYYYYYYYFYFYYFYYNYYRCKHYYKILSKIAQRSNVALNWERREGPFATVITTRNRGRNSSSVKNVSLTINRVKERSSIYKIIMTSTSEAPSRSSRARTRESDAASAVGATVAGDVGEAFARARVASSRAHSAGFILGSARSRQLNHVSGVTSDPKCQFQTFS